MVSIKTKAEIDLMRKGGRILGGALAAAKDFIKPGISTKEIEEVVMKFLNSKQAEPSFLNFRGYPAAACVSVNEEVVHGIPGSRKLRSDDIVSVDVGVRYKGLYTDAAFTQAVSTCSPEVAELVKITKESLAAGIAEIAPGKHLGDIGAAISAKAAQYDFAVIRDLVGHGVGHGVHEDPQVPNFGERGKGLELKEGMALALEPMLALGTYEVKCLDDGWTFVTADKKMSAHFEHTVAINSEGAEILTE